MTIVLPPLPDTEVCSLCHRTVCVTGVVYPASQKMLECEHGPACPMNAEYKFKPEDEFNSPPEEGTIIYQLEFCDEEAG